MSDPPGPAPGAPPASSADRLRALLGRDELTVAPGCFDALSARLVERAGFAVAFMGGFAVAGARSALPDTGLLSYGEVLDQGRSICDAVTIPVIGDADTGWGNAMNVRRTVHGFAGAGFACVMIEDQLAPKRCGHTRGKQVVDRSEAVARIRAAVDARTLGADVAILARTDARATHGIDEAIARAQAFREIGADITFVEAPLSPDEMLRVCAEVDGPCLVNLVEDGDTPILSDADLADIGYRIAIRPLTLQMAAVSAMQATLEALAGRGPEPSRVDFAGLRAIVGFDDYLRDADRYA